MTWGLLHILAQTTPAAATGDGSYLAWALALLTIAVALFFVEVFVPSGGLLAIASTVALISGITLMFWEDTTFGTVTLLVVLLALPFALAMMIRIMPSTPFFRMLTLGDPRGDDAQDPDDEDAADADRGTPQPGPLGHPLVGKTGKAMTDLRPVGTVLLDGQREECLAQGGMIEAGTTVRVVAVDGLQIKVRPA